MMIPQRWMIFLLACSLFACEKNNENTPGTDVLLIGSWFNPQYNDSIVIYERSKGLVDNEYGFSFNGDNSFIERKNAGWCGTPPISYADFDGTWTRNDSIVEITVGYWGGTAEYSWKILAVDGASLKLERLDEIYYLEE
jgi:hypothetical protein